MPENEIEVKVITGEEIILSFEQWLKFIEGFLKGIESSSTLSSPVVLDCIGEIMEYMRNAKCSISQLFSHCEQVLQENDKLQEEIQQLKEENEQLTKKLNKIKER